MYVYKYVHMKIYMKPFHYPWVVSVVPGFGPNDRKLHAFLSHAI